MNVKRETIYQRVGGVKENDKGAKHMKKKESVTGEQTERGIYRHTSRNFPVRTEVPGLLIWGWSQSKGEYPMGWSLELHIRG